MKSKLRKFAATAIVVGSAFAATAANAAPPPGSNGGPDHVRSAGSDTTYDMMNRLNALYNASVGCNLNVGSPDFGNTCGVGGTETENYDHDTVVEEYAIGSSNGINKMRLGDLTVPALVQARSSRAINAANNNTTKENGVVGSSFAKDGLSVIVFLGLKSVSAPNNVPGFAGDPSTVSLTVTQLERIFSGAGGGCASDWSQIGNPGGLTGGITPYGLQTGSGTYQAFDALITGDPNACANGIAAPTCNAGAGTCTTTRILFENNSAPIDGGVGSDGITYKQPLDRTTAIWWGSAGALSVDKVSRGTTSPFQVGGKLPDSANVLDNTYPLVRKLWNVNKKLDVSFSAPLGSPVGTAATVAPRGIAGNADFTGARGAAYNYRAWLCRNGGHANLPKNYNTEISNAITASGFVRVSGAFDPVSVNPVTGATERCVLDNFIGSGAPDDKVIPANWNA
jgi:ABC-type phosphate transport system substrate-binding protein